MPRSSSILIWGAVLTAVVLALAQESREEWSLKKTGTEDLLRFTIRRIKPGSQWSNTNEVPRSRFRGLSIDTLDHGGPAKFDYVHDAGTLHCEGVFSWDGGSGKYTFMPSSTFASELRSMGYDAPDSDQLFTMMMTDISLAFARTVKDAGLNASTKQLIDLRIHGVDAEFIRETRRAGYENFRAQEYIDMKIHGVGTQFLRDLKAAGYNLDARGIVELRIHGVTSEFMRDLKQAGYDLPAHQIAQLRIQGVSSEFLRDLKNYGLKPRADDLIQLRMHGVSADYLKGLKDSGYGNLTSAEIVQLRIHGVDTQFLQKAQELGYRFTPDDVVKLRIHGVTADYLRNLKESGMRNLTAEQIARLKINGVQ